MSTPSNTSRYLEIADAILGLITSGQVRPGQQLPSEMDLAARWGVSKPTVSKAYKSLVQRALVVPKERQGYFVPQDVGMTWTMASRDNLRAAANPMNGWTPTVEGAGRRAMQRIEVRTVNAERVVMDRSLADLLGLTPGDLVVARDCTRYIDGIASEIAVTYIGYDLAGGTDLMRPEDIPDVAPILAGLGHPMTGFEDTTRSRHATRAESARLELDTGLPVMELLREELYGPDRTCLVVRHSIYRGGGTKFRWEVDL